MTEVQMDSASDKSYTRNGFDRIATGDRMMQPIRQIQTGPHLSGQSLGTE